MVDGFTEEIRDPSIHPGPVFASSKGEASPVYEVNIVIPDWVWIPIVLFSGALISVITWRLVKANIRAKIGGQELSIENSFPGSHPLSSAAGCSDEQLGMLRKLERMLTALYDRMGLEVLEFMSKTLEMPKDSLSNNGDLIFIWALIWQVVYGKNGKQSIRTILEDYIITKDYYVDKTLALENQIQKRQNLMRLIIPQIDGEIQKLFEDKYDNVYTLYNPALKEVHQETRAITREQLAEILRRYTKEKLSPLVEILLFEEE
jgi:hypothetical protein